MSVGDTRWIQTDNWFDRMSDWGNAILIKETRQALKSKQFVMTFLLLLAGAWLISVFGMLNAGPSIEYGSQGRDFFFWFYIVLAVATIFIVPFGAYRSLLAERDLGTFELLNITSLSPRQIVWGKLLSSLVQLFIFYSAITPFIAFASLLQGFDAPSAAYILTATFLSSIMLCMFALMLSTIAKGKASQSGMSMLLLGGLFTAMSTTMTSVWGILESEVMDFDNSEFWWITLFFFLGGASYFLLFQQVTTARLTFESDDRSSGIRMVAMGQFLLLWGSFLVAMWIWGYSPYGLSELVMSFVAMSGVHWMLIGLFSATEAEFLSRRVRRDLPKNKLLRILKLPFLPGASRGYFFILIQMFLLWWFAAFGFTYTQSSTLSSIFTTGSTTSPVAPSMGQLFSEVGSLLTSSPADWPQYLCIATGIACYITIYLGIGCALGRWIEPVVDDVKPVHVRVVLILGITGGIIMPHILSVLDMIPDLYRGYSMIFITEPFATMDHLSRDGAYTTVILNTLIAVSMIVIAINTRAILSGLKHVYSSNLKPAEPTVPV